MGARAPSPFPRSVFVYLPMPGNADVLRLARFHQTDACRFPVKLANAQMLLELGAFKQLPLRRVGSCPFSASSRLASKAI